MARRPKPAPAMGRARLEWEYVSVTSVWRAEAVVARGYSRHASTYEDRSLFAQVRPARAGDGLFSEAHGFVVAGRSFDDVRAFPTLAEAKLYVESLFQLEV